MGKRIEIETGARFGHLVVLGSSVYKTRCNSQRWVCECDCGSFSRPTGYDLRRGASKTCGCHRHNRLPEGESHFNEMFREYKYRAKKYKRVWGLGKEEFRTLISQDCRYCGQEPTLRYVDKTCKYNGYTKSNGLDRIDSSKGYTKDNVVACCFRCNQGKSDLPEDEFLDWVAKVYYHNFGDYHK